MAKTTVSAIKIPDECIERTNTYASEFCRGAAHGRDNIICLIMGIQNNMADTESSEYRELQKLLEEIIERYGDLFEMYKG